MDGHGSDSLRTQAALLLSPRTVLSSDSFLPFEVLKAIDRGLKRVSAIPCSDPVDGMWWLPSTEVRAVGLSERVPASAGRVSHTLGRETRILDYNLNQVRRRYNGYAHFAQRKRKETKEGLQRYTRMVSRSHKGEYKRFRAPRVDPVGSNHTPYHQQSGS